jgi:hypothetical protein
MDLDESDDEERLVTLIGVSCSSSALSVHQQCRLVSQDGIVQAMFTG